MREIKFRAWEDGKMYFWKLHDSEAAFEGGKSGGWLPNPDSPTMQFTGLKDKNGKEIYEGDIVRCGYNQEDTEEIVFVNGGFGYRDCTWDYFEEEYGHSPMEVIGNIYENPELIN